MLHIERFNAEQGCIFTKKNSLSGLKGSPWSWGGGFLKAGSN